VDKKDLAATMKLFGNQMKKRRTDLELTQDSVAAVAGIHLNHYGKIERGLKRLQIGTMTQVLKALELDLFTVFDNKKTRAAETKKLNDPERNWVVEQLDDILATGGEDADDLKKIIDKWHKRLKKT
jgi:transcriptional regulator with XRE-family HTH domain